MAALDDVLTWKIPPAAADEVPKRALLAAAGRIELTPGQIKAMQLLQGFADHNLRRARAAQPTIMEVHNRGDARDSLAHIADSDLDRFLADAAATQGGEGEAGHGESETRPDVLPEVDEPKAATVPVMPAT